MKEYYTDAISIDDIAKELVRYIERETDETVFTVRVDEEGADDKLNVLIVFESREIMTGEISLMIEDDHLTGLRVQGVYI